MRQPKLSVASLKEANILSVVELIVTYYDINAGELIHNHFIIVLH